MIQNNMENLKDKFIRFIDNTFHLKMETAEQEVSDVKQEAVDKVKETTATLKTADKLQKQIMQKTTTYYLGKATGAIK